MIGEILLTTTIVGGLIVSEEPTPQAIEDYKAWGANAVVVWEADQAALWDPIPATVWVDENYQSTFVRSNQRFTEALEPPAPNVFALQVGDEPPSRERLANLKVSPIAAYTNFSYWAPPDEQAFLELLEVYEGDWLSVSEYNLGPYRPYILNLVREAALGKGIPYWQYMNAYSGYETEFTKSHTFADYAWQGFTGLAMGYTGHIWFAYQLSDQGHPEAIQGGGSTITAAPGSWSLNPDHYRWTGTVNRMLLRYGQVTSYLTSTDVCFPRLADWLPDSSCKTKNTITGTFDDGTQVTVNDSRTENVQVNVEQQYVYLPSGVAFETEGGPVWIDPGMALMTSDKRHEGFLWMG